MKISLKKLLVILVLVLIFVNSFFLMKSHYKKHNEDYRKSTETYLILKKNLTHSTWTGWFDGDYFWLLNDVNLIKLSRNGTIIASFSVNKYEVFQ